MNSDAVWRAFAETGDPVCYLLYKSVERKKTPKDDKDRERAGRVPFPED